MKIKLLSLIVAMLMLLSVFAGCQSSELRSYSDEEPDESTQPTETVDTTDYDAAYASYDPDEVMMSVNGKDVTWDQLFYWMYYDVSGIEGYIGRIEDWSAKCPLDEEKTYEEFVKSNAMEVVSHYSGLESKAKELGIELTDEDRASLEETWKKNVENYGSGDEQEFIEYLRKAYLSKDLYNYINEINLLYNKVMEEVCGENGSKLDQAEIISSAEEQSYVHAKNILFRTVDDEQKALSDEEIAAKKTAAEAALAQLKSISDPTALEAKFDELMKAQSEDTGLEYFPDGYVYTPGTMVAQFETAAEALDEYAVSEIVETDYGFHIILRLPLSPENVVDNYGDGSVQTLGDYVVSTIFNNMTTAWADEAKVETTKVYDKLDLSKVFSAVKKAESEAK